MVGLNYGLHIYRVSYKGNTVFTVTFLSEKQHEHGVRNCW